jgi:hypothetical protein
MSAAVAVALAAGTTSAFAAPAFAAPPAPVATTASTSGGETASTSGGATASTSGATTASTSGGGTASTSGATTADGTVPGAQQTQAGAGEEAPTEQNPHDQTSNEQAENEQTPAEEEPAAPLSANYRLKPTKVKVGQVVDLIESDVVGDDQAPVFVFRTVFWGDGTKDEFATITGTPDHKYKKPGTYKVTVELRNLELEAQGTFPDGNTVIVTAATPATTSPTPVPGSGSGGNGGGGGLAATGPSAGLIAGGGAAMILIGAGSILLTRRRKTLPAA